MATRGEHERRNRITCNIPLKNAAQEKAFKEIIFYIQNLRDEKIGVGGYTYSTPGTFLGFWWDDSRKLVQDKIVLLVIDLLIPLDHPVHSLSEVVSELKQVISTAFEKYGRPEDEVWVTEHPIQRYL